VYHCEQLTINCTMTSVATAPVAAPPPFNPQYAAAPPTDAAAWQQQQQQFLQWQQFQQWQQQQESATAYPVTQPVNTGAVVPPATAVPAFSDSLSQPVPNNVSPNGANEKDASTNTNPTGTTSASSANPTSSTNASSSTSSSGNVFDQLSALLSALSTGLNSVNSNGSSLWKSVATTGQQMQPFMKLCKACASS
jgi:hypothetical protein